MSSIRIVVFLINLTSLVALGQTLPASGDFPQQLPRYLVGVGAEVNPTGILTALAVRISNTSLYSWTTMDTPAQQILAHVQIVASVRTGVAYIAAHNGSCFLFLLGDSGISAAPGTATLGAYSGGAGVFCHPKSLSNLYVGPLVRAMKLSSSSIQPVAEIMASWSF